MGKRPLENPSEGRIKRPCTKPLAGKPNPSEAVDDKRKLGISNVIQKKRTVPQPFQLSSRSAWREAQTQRQREQDEARRQQLETFKPIINATNKRLVPCATKVKKQECQPIKEDKENKPDVSGSITAATSRRAPMCTITNTVTVSTTRAHCAAKQAKGLADQTERSAQPKSLHGKPVTTSVPVMGTTVQMKSQTNHRVVASVAPPRLITGRYSMGSQTAKAADGRMVTNLMIRRRASVGAHAPEAQKASSARGPCPASSLGNVTHIQAPSLANPLAPPSKACPAMLARRATAGPAQHAMAQKAERRRVVTFEEPNGDPEAAIPSSAVEEICTNADGRSRAVIVKGAQSAIPVPPCLTTPMAKSGADRSSSAPVPGTCTRSDSSCTGIQLSDDDEESVQNYGPDGYCHIVKGSTFCDGRYTALHKLGEGKYSTVWLMHDRDGPYTEYSNFVAVKVGRAMSSDVLPEDIKREANLLEYINATHEPSDLRYLATVIGSFVHEGRHGLHACMVFKVLGSQLLRLVYERNEAFRAGVPLDVPSVINIFRCILRGTAGFHRKNIVHTDLKPENILLAVPDPEIVEQMKAFTRERNLPEPYLEHRPQASVTPHRRVNVVSPETAAKRSDSVDPLDFWKKRSSPDPLGDADMYTAESNKGRPTMACLAREDSFALQPEPSMPTMSNSEFPPLQPSARDVATIEARGTDCQASDGGTQALSLPGFVCTQRGGAGCPNNSPVQGFDCPESPPASMALHQTPSKGSPLPTCHDMDVDEDCAKDSLALPLTPQGEERRVNPSTPQYVLDQGKGTDVLIGDFGLAMVLEHGHELAPPGVHIYPQDCVVMNHNHGMVIQTREYRAPEILLGQDFNVKIDIYSIACIMVELITGEYLWDPKNTVPRRSSHIEQEIDREHFQHMVEVVGVDEFAKLRARRTCFKARFFMPNGEPRIQLARRRKPKSRPLLSILVPHVPNPVLPALAYLLAKMLEFHPNDRWSAAQCLEFLDQPVFAEQSAVTIRGGRYSLRSSTQR